MLETQFSAAANPQAVFVFAHGAGADMDHEFMQQMTALLLERNISVLRFNFAYMTKRKEDGKRRPPPRLERLLEEYSQVLADSSLQTDLPIFIGGKSMGSRVATHINLEKKVAGVICLGYPFHPSGKADKLRLDHLAGMLSPTLIVQGQRDSLGNEEEISGYDLPLGIQVEYVTDGDHSFKPRKASGLTLQDNLLAAADSIAQFVRNHD